MCLIAFAWKVHPDHPLLLVANRDEFHARPAAPLAWWEDRSQILAGRDLAEGGTWLGASRSGRFAAVTNVRGPDAALRRPQSRGALVTDFLAGTMSAAEFARALEPVAGEFGGFNLLLLDDAGLRYLSNRPAAFVSQAIAPGLHALSNAQLDTPWPKARAARAAVSDWIARDLADEEALFEAMANPAPAADAALPQTGVGLEMERLLSPAFIRTPSYGTRCTTQVQVGPAGTSLRERRFDAQGRPIGETRLTTAG